MTETEAIDLRRRTLTTLAAAPPGTLIYADTPSATTLRQELDQRLRERGLCLRDVGAFHLEVAARPPAVREPQPGACLYCRGTVWCGRCQRCGTAV